MSIHSRVGFGAFACVAAGAFLGWFQPDPTRMVFLSVGQGDCALIQAGGRALLIDVGPRSTNFDAGERLVLPKLRDLGVEQIDLILISHPDMDHMGGLQAVLHAFPNARVAASAAFQANEEMRQHLAELKIPFNQIDWLGPESSGQIGPLSIRLACPPLPPDGEANDGSMFVHIGAGQAWATFSGDASEYVEDRMAPLGDWSAEVMKVGHHGSRTSSSPLWLQEVHPKWAIVSCGRENPYGHPHREAIERLTAAKAQVARTDREGEITFELRDGHFVRSR